MFSLFVFSFPVTIFSAAISCRRSQIKPKQYYSVFFFILLAVATIFPQVKTKFQEDWFLGETFRIELTGQMRNPSWPRRKEGRKKDRKYSSQHALILQNLSFCFCFVCLSLIIFFFCFRSLIKRRREKVIVVSYKHDVPTFKSWTERDAAGASTTAAAVRCCAAKTASSTLDPGQREFGSLLFCFFEGLIDRWCRI